MVSLFFRWFALVALGAVQFGGDAATLVDPPRVTFTNGTRVVIRWSTDVSTGTRVFYGKSANQMTRRADGAEGAKHVVLLPALEAGSEWYYSVGTARVPLATNSFRVPDTGSGKRTETGNVEKTIEKAPPTRETWGQMSSLRDHFERHGADFRAKDTDDYARMAWEFRERARREGLPTKIDTEGVMRIYDPKTQAFGAYNRNGTTKTFFKPRSPEYFERQPGKLLQPKEVSK